MARIWIFITAAGLTALGSLFLGQSPEASLLLRLLVSLCGAATVLLLRKLLAKKPKSDAFGSAAFATNADKEDLVQRSSGPVEPGAILLGTSDAQQIILSPEQARRHGIIVGGSGSGKSFSFFLPNAARLRGTSLIFSDPKSELFRFTSGFHQSLRFAPCEPDASEGFNWIPMCKQPRLAEVAARAVVESGKTAHTEQIWLDLEAAFLAALFSHTSTLSVPTPLTAYRLFTQQNQKTLLAQLAKSKSIAAREQANIFEQTSERMRGSIVPAVAARLQWMRDPQIARFTSARLTAPNFAALRRQPIALYYCLNEKDIPRLRPLTSLFFTLLMEALSGEATDTRKAVPILFFLDEFGVIGALPDFEATIALARGRGMGFWLGVQSLSQLESAYGRSAAQTILTNCSTKIALAGLDVETAEYFSRSLGQGTIARKMRSWQRKRFSLFASTLGDALQEQGRFLLTADEVRRLSDEQMLIVTGNRRAMLLEKVRYTAIPSAVKTKPLTTANALNYEVENPEKGHSILITKIKPVPPFPSDL